MHSGLKRLQQAQALHFVTFSCFHRLPVLQAPGAMETVEAVLEQTRARHQARVYAYVLMPEHGIRPSKATLFTELIACSSFLPSYWLFGSCASTYPTVRISS